MKPEPLGCPLLLGISTVLSLSSKSSHDLKVAGAIAVPCSPNVGVDKDLLPGLYFQYMSMIVSSECVRGNFKVRVFHAKFYNHCSGLVHFVNPFRISDLPTSEYLHLFSNAYSD